MMNEAKRLHPIAIVIYITKRLKHRIQSLTISQSRMQQRLGLCTVHATVMPGIRAKVVDVDESTAKTIYEWFLGN
ncbi:PH domain-containing protein [Anoxybacillus kestanbolensis]|uniref:PH domain-containing protein n=1 Tax=Anoxybacillus kestanbolensis TaxID=227476 RepID=UPI00208DBFB9|nr:PH domain-containing protein [Anoxybacillus kestanbolensis]MCL9971508.1 PH domain-containing protein [Anoxybacillus kestanbolensis]